MNKGHKRAKGVLAVGEEEALGAVAPVGREDVDLAAHRHRRCARGPPNPAASVVQKHGKKKAHTKKNGKEKADVGVEQSVATVAVVTMAVVMVVMAMAATATVVP